jgi:hypothetical protein
MGVFFVLLLVPIMIQHIAIKGYHIDYQKRNKMALAFFFFLLTLLVMLRHETVGNDTTNYIYYFERYSYMDWALLRKQELELGYVYLNKLLSLFSKESRVFLAVSAVLASAMIYPTYKRLCEDSSLTIVLYCIMSTFVMMFSGIRQMLSIGLGVVAYEFTRQKKLIPFAAMVLLTISIHTSGFMLVFMYPLYHAKITKKWLYVVVPIMAVIYVFNRQIFSVLAIILETYTKYSGAISSTGAYTMLILFAGFTVFAFLIPDESKLNEEIIGLRNFLLLALVIQMFAPLHTLAMRMNYYYIIFIPLLLPKIIEYRSKRWNQVALLGRHVMVIFFLVYFFANAYRGSNLHVFPYHFFWESIG